MTPLIPGESVWRELRCKFCFRPYFLLFTCGGDEASLLSTKDSFDKKIVIFLYTDCYALKVYWLAPMESGVRIIRKQEFLVFFHSKDVRLPVQLQRVMAAEAEATREARAKVSRIASVLFISLFIIQNRKRIPSVLNAKYNVSFFNYKIDWNSTIWFLGYCCWRWNDVITFFKGSRWHNGGGTVGDAASLSADSEHNLSWKELHHRLPNPCGFYGQFFTQVKLKLQVWGKEV